MADGHVIREAGYFYFRLRNNPQVLIRRVPDEQQFLDVRVAVLGCADAGKSTLLGVVRSFGQIKIFFSSSPKASWTTGADVRV